jgi:hypothetical protein
MECISLHKGGVERGERIVQSCSYGFQEGLH